MDIEEFKRELLRSLREDLDGPPYGWRYIPRAIGDVSYSHMSTKVSFEYSPEGPKEEVRIYSYGVGNGMLLLCTMPMRDLHAAHLARREKIRAIEDAAREQDRGARRAKFFAKFRGFR